MRIRPTSRPLRAGLLSTALLGVALAAGACSSSGSGSAASVSGAGGKIDAVGAENEYADVLSQIGGQYVDATAIMSNPNTDPHTFEASAQVASEVSGRSEERRVGKEC